MSIRPGRLRCQLMLASTARLAKPKRMTRTGPRTKLSEAGLIRESQRLERAISKTPSSTCRSGKGNVADEPGGSAGSIAGGAPGARQPRGAASP